MIPTEWFHNPALPAPTPITITNDGRLLGHLIRWEPESPFTYLCPRPSTTGYSRFHTRQLVDTVVALEDPPRHKTRGVGAIQMMYDTIIAYVRAGDDEHGLWLAGGLVPGLDELTVASLRDGTGTGFSGCWTYGELTEIRVINPGEMPGFVIERTP